MSVRDVASVSLISRDVLYSLISLLLSDSILQGEPNENPLQILLCHSFVLGRLVRRKFHPLFFFFLICLHSQHNQYTLALLCSWWARQG